MKKNQRHFSRIYIYIYIYVCVCNDIRTNSGSAFLLAYKVSRKLFLPLFCGRRKLRKSEPMALKLNLFTSQPPKLPSLFPQTKPSSRSPKFLMASTLSSGSKWVLIPSAFEYLQRLSCIHVSGLTNGSLCIFVFWGCLWIWVFVFVPCNLAYVVFFSVISLALTVK